MSDLGNILSELKVQTDLLRRILELQTGGASQAESETVENRSKPDRPLTPRQAVPPMPVKKEGLDSHADKTDVKPDGVTVKPWKYQNVHSCVFNFMIAAKSKGCMGLTRDQAAKATKILKRNGDWTPPKLGALLYAFAQDPLPDDPFTFAGGCLNGKSAARADFERYENRAAELLRSFELRVAKDTGAENVEVQSETGDAE